MYKQAIFTKEMLEQMLNHFSEVKGLRTVDVAVNGKPTESQIKSGKYVKAKFKRAVLQEMYDFFYEKPGLQKIGVAVDNKTGKINTKKK